MKEAQRQLKKGIVILGILFAAAVLIWSYNLFRLREIRYEGLTRYTEEEFTEMIADTFFDTWTPLFCLKDMLGQEEIPFVEKYEVEYLNRNTVRVTVHEKRVIGCIPLMGRYMYFDKDGIVVESSPERLGSIPLISGLEFSEIVLYEKLEVQKQSLYATILALTRLIEENGLQIEEISFASDYEVSLLCGAIEIALGKRDSYDEQLNALEGILAAAEGRSGVLDMRTYSKENPDVILK